MILRFWVEGTVEDSETGLPLVGLIVRAFDKDFLFDDDLGFSITDELGHFSIHFTEDDFRDFAERSPDLYLRVHDSTGESLLHQTPVHRNFVSDENFRIRISGTRAMLPSGRLLPRQTELTVDILPAIAPGDPDFESPRKLAEAARQRILAALGEPEL